MTDLTEIWIGAIVGTVPTYDPFTKKGPNETKRPIVCQVNVELRSF